MTALSQILAGGRLTAAAVQGIAPLPGVKAVDQILTNSATLQSDSALYLPLAANSTYTFISQVVATSTEPLGSGDIKIAFTWPAGATAQWCGTGLGASGGAGITANPVIAVSGSARGFGINGSTLTEVWIKGLIIVGSTPGNLQLQWAMNTAVAANSTTVKALSWLQAELVG